MFLYLGSESGPRVEFVGGEGALGCRRFVLPAVLGRWSWLSYFLCGLMVFAAGRFVLDLVLLFVLVSCLAFWSPRC